MVTFKTKKTDNYCYKITLKKQNILFTLPSTLSTSTIHAFKEKNIKRTEI